MIAAYPDLNGYVGERRLSDNADDVADVARGIRRRLENMQALIEDLVCIADAKADAADADPAGYRRSHVAAWGAAETQYGRVEEALAALAKMMREA